MRILPIYVLTLAVYIFDSGEAASNGTVSQPLKIYLGNGALLFLSVLGIVFTIAAIISFLTFYNRKKHLCFPYNTWYTQFLFLAGLIVVFILVILYICAPSRFEYFGPVPFVICFSCLLVNALNLLLIYRYRIGLPSWMLVWMAFFCIFITPLVTLHVYKALVYVTNNACYNGTSLVNATNVVNSTSSAYLESVSIWNSLITYLDTSLYLYVYYLIVVSLFLSCFSIKKSLYANYLFITLLLSWLLWTIHWCVSSTILLPATGVTVNGYIFLLLYVLPPILYFHYERLYLSHTDVKTTSKEGKPQTTL
uniref:G protein-coupled receptor 5 n=3 Tax=Elephant endotheliotropic herpesvirus 1A TaxID=759753 RepID=A0A866VTH4_ELHV1|nr:G protein-coupled receptor 5 [Elephant endotheliotropic herpesvirus 1A]